MSAGDFAEQRVVLESELCAKRAAVGKPYRVQQSTGPPELGCSVDMVVGMDDYVEELG
jgi:hypothetical protein